MFCLSLSHQPSSVNNESTEPKASNVNRRKRQALIVIAVAAVMVWPGMLAVRSYQSSSFQSACEAARDLEDWRTLRETAAKWVEWNPNAAEGWWFAAEAAQELDDLEDLAACLGNVPESDPKVLFALVEKANLEWTSLNRPLDGLKTSQQVIEIDPRVLEIHSRIISFYGMNLQRAPMLEAIRRSMKAGAEPRESYTYLMLADLLSFTNGAELNSRWLASSPDEVRFKIGLAVNTAMNVAMSVDSNRKEDVVELDAEARQQLQWFLDEAPHDPVLLTYLMYRAYQAADVDRVGSLLKQVDTEGATDHMVWVLRAWYHTTFDEFDEAEQAIQEALKLHPMSPLAHHEYANLLRRTQSPDVELHQKLAAEGRELRSLLLRQPTVVDLDVELLQRIQEYAKECGDELVVSALARRLQPAPPSRSPLIRNLVR